MTTTSKPTKTQVKPKLDPKGTLPDADLSSVSGGLNPQPLPPRWR